MVSHACILHHEIHGISNAWDFMKFMGYLYGLHEISYEEYGKLTAGSKNCQIGQLEGCLPNLQEGAGGCANKERGAIAREKSSRQMRTHKERQENSNSTAGLLKTAHCHTKAHTQGNARS